MLDKNVQRARQLLNILQYWLGCGGGGGGAEHPWDVCIMLARIDVAITNILRPAIITCDLFSLLRKSRLTSISLMQKYFTVVQFVGHIFKLGHKIGRQVLKYPTFCGDIAKLQFSFVIHSCSILWVTQLGHMIGRQVLKYPTQAVGARSAALSLRGARSCLLGSLRSQPKGRFAPQSYTGHTWSQSKWLNLSSTRHSLYSLIPHFASYHYEAGHIWSQLVTNCSLVTGGHIGNNLSLSNSIRKEISVVTESQTDGRSPLIV